MLPPQRRRTPSPPLLRQRQHFRRIRTLGCGRFGPTENRQNRSAARSSDQVYHASIQHQGSSPPCTTVPHRLPSVSGREVRSSLGIRTSPYRLAGPLSFQYRSPPWLGAVCGCLCFVVSSACVCSCLFARAGRRFRSCCPASSLPVFACVHMLSSQSQASGLCLPSAARLCAIYTSSCGTLVCHVAGCPLSCSRWCAGALAQGGFKRGAEGGQGGAEMETERSAQKARRPGSPV